jgi:hypothetical protein
VVLQQTARPGGRRKSVYIGIGTVLLIILIVLLLVFVF